MRKRTKETLNNHVGNQSLTPGDEGDTAIGRKVLRPSYPDKRNSVHEKIPNGDLQQVNTFIIILTHKCGSLGQGVRAQLSRLQMYPSVLLSCSLSLPLSLSLSIDVGPLGTSFIVLSSNQWPRLFVYVYLILSFSLLVNK